MLSKTGFSYYQVLYNTAADRNTPYTQRCDAVYEAVDVIKDLDYSMSHKCRARISLLTSLEKLQHQQNDFKGIQKLSNCGKNTPITLIILFGYSPTAKTNSYTAD